MGKDVLKFILKEKEFSKLEDFPPPRDDSDEDSSSKDNIEEMLISDWIIKQNAK